MLYDIWETIQRWRDRGVVAEVIAFDLRKVGLSVPHNTWGSVASAMAAYSRIKNL